MSDLVANNDQVMAGTPFSILRRRSGSKNSNPLKGGIHATSGGVLPKDIVSLLSDF